MRPSTELFDLIKSLSKSEKRFFKLYSSLQSGEKNYSRLFDYIEKQSVYDESKLKEHFHQETFINNLPSEKNHLYKLILKSLRQFHNKQSVASILKREIKNVEILYNRTLLKEAFKILKRAKKIAHEYEEFYFLIDLIAWEKTLITTLYESGDFDFDLNKLIAEESDTLQKLMNLAAYHILYSKINAIFRSDGFIKNQQQRQQVLKISEHPLIKGKNTAISTRAATICYYIQGLCAAVERDFETSYARFNKVKDLLDASPKIKQELGLRYVLTLNHLMNCYKENRNFGMAQKTLNAILALENTKGFKSAQISIRIKNIGLTDQMHLYNLQGQFNKALTHYFKNEKSYLSMLEKSSKENKIEFYFTIAYTYFGVEQYKEALHYVNLLINDNEQQLRQDIYGFTRVLNTLLHFELNNLEYIEYCANAAVRYLNKVQQEHQIDIIFIKQLKKTTNASFQKNPADFYLDSFDIIAQLLKKENEQVILGFIDIQSWLQSKIDQLPFQVVVQHQA